MIDPITGTDKKQNLFETDLFFIEHHLKQDNCKISYPKWFGLTSSIV